MPTFPISVILQLRTPEKPSRDVWKISVPTDLLSFADSKGTDILLNILSFDLPDQAALEGHIIRSSDDEGMYIVGCQMPEDNMAIKDYVEQLLG